MINISKTNLYIGSIADLKQAPKEDFAFVHATQTIHYEIMSWDKEVNKPDRTHPNYVFYRDDNYVSLNWVDGGMHLYVASGTVTFKKVLDFVEDKLVNKKVLIHCDRGCSRALTLGLLYLAKRFRVIPSDSFDAAAEEFKKEYYSNYAPGGIADFVRINWVHLT